MTPRRVLITGASKGIGYVLAELLAAAGHRPVGLARTAPADYPGEFHPADLADRTTTAEVLDRVLARGPVDAVVNNVALVRPARIGAVDLDDLAAVYDLTVRVAVQATQAALPGMIERGWGRIVNITSTVTLGKPERTSYGAAKAALEFCSRAWGGELATTGVTVNSVAPGPTETALFRENNPHGSAGEARYLAGIPIGRLGQPHESRRPSPSCSPRTPASSLARRCGWTAAAASGRADMRRSIEELPAVFPDRSCCSVKKIYSEARAMLAEIDD